MFESKSGILLVGGLGFFAFAFLSNALVPALLYRHMPEQTTAQLVASNSNLMYQFENLSQRYPESFAAHFGSPTPENCAEALELGRRVYTGEGCWHCHSQFIRPVSREADRWGPVSKTYEYQNELQRPVMFGTRRVGPDLSREGGRRSNDWHAVHFFKPTLLSADSPMPAYPWLFHGSPDKPNKRGLALITYVQWLGSWLESYPLYEAYAPLPIPRSKILPGASRAGDQNVATESDSSEETSTGGAAKESAAKESEAKVSPPESSTPKSSETTASEPKSSATGSNATESSATEAKESAATKTAKDQPDGSSK